MLKNIIRQLHGAAHSRWYWLTYILGGTALLAAALIYQYVYDEPPCLLCIQVRLWISLFVLVSFLGLLFRHTRVINIVTNLSVVLIALALTERSYQLLGNERGFIIGECGFDLGLPTWFPIDAWLPWLYRVEATCGATPEIAFGITMAEELMVFSVCLLVVGFFVLLASFAGTDD